MISQRNARADGRQRKDRKAPIKRVLAREKLTSSGNDGPANGLPVGGVCGHLQDLWRADNEIGRQRFGDSTQVERMIAAQHNRSPARARTPALRQRSPHPGLVSLFDVYELLDRVKAGLPVNAEAARSLETHHGAS
jgi:hypothetical protein